VITTKQIRVFWLYCASVNGYLVLPYTIGIYHQTLKKMGPISTFSHIYAEKERADWKNLLLNNNATHLLIKFANENDSVNANQPSR
jgi:hypothetical protein